MAKQRYRYIRVTKKNSKSRSDDKVGGINLAVAVSFIVVVVVICKEGFVESFLGAPTHTARGINCSR